MNYLLSDRVMVQRVIRAPSVALFLDFDGTIVPLAPAPDAIRVPETLPHILKTLAARPGYTVGIISGRTVADLSHYVQVPESVVVAGNHGLEWVIRGTYETAAVPAAYPEALQALYTACVQYIEKYPGAHVDWKGLSISIQLRSVSPVSVPRARTGILERIAHTENARLFAVIPGGTDIDVRPNISWTKASVISRVLSEEGIRTEDTVCIYIGDDTTDEDVFRAFPSALTIHVGRSYTSLARYYLRDVSDVYAFLTLLAKPLP